MLTDAGFTSMDSTTGVLERSRSREGDTALLLANAGAVQRFCRAQLASDADVEDAVQDTFVRFLQRPDGEIRNPEAWLIAVARRACQDVIRKRQRSRQEELTDIPISAREPALEDAVLTGALVRELFKSLRRRDARLLEQLYVSGWSIEQVARELNVPNGHVRVMALRARRRAAHALEGMGAGRSVLGLAPWATTAWQRLGAQAAILRRRLHRAGDSWAGRPRLAPWRRWPWSP